MAALLRKSVGSMVPGAWSTPQILRAALSSIWVLALLFVSVLWMGVQQQQQALQEISQNLAPSMIAAERIKAGLSDMDATAADVLLLSHGEQQEQCDDRYEARRVEVTETLANVVQRGTHSNAEYEAIRALSTGLATYENDVVLARWLHLRGQAGSRLVFRMTHSQMHDVLLPAADAFGNAVHGELETQYRRRQARSGLMRVLGWVTGGALFACLLITQLFLSHRMHRTLNLGLLCATILLLGLLLFTQKLFAQNDVTAQTMKSSLGSVMTLWQIRGLAFDADAEESRWLMDTPQAPQYEQAYFAQSNLILALPSGVPSMADLIRLDKQGTLSNDVTGSLALVIRNAGSSHARSEARDMLLTYGAYADTDGQLRTMEEHGDHGGAVAFCIGRQPGQHDHAFLMFDAALGTLLAEQQRTFDGVATEGLRRFGGYSVLASLLLLALLSLSGIGMRPRLQEYAL